MAGLYYEEFSVGQVFEHPIRRTVTDTDNILFTTMTHNPARLHLDDEYMKNETEFGDNREQYVHAISDGRGYSV